MLSTLESIINYKIIEKSKTIEDKPGSLVHIKVNNKHYLYIENSKTIGRENFQWAPDLSPLVN